MLEGACNDVGIMAFEPAESGMRLADKDLMIPDVLSTSASFCNTGFCPG